MHVTRLALSDFRSYASVDVPLTPGVTTFVGPNGQGKTNLLEAMQYAATLGSHRVGTDAPLVRLGAARAIVRLAVRRAERMDRPILVELEITPGRANRARVNRAPVPRPREVLGLVRTVLFAPEDLALVKGDPGERRRYLDDLLVARAPRLAGVRGDYERVLKQRNALLKSAGTTLRGRPSTGADLRTLEVWDAQLAAAGAELLAARLELVDALAPLVDKAHAAVASSQAPRQSDARPPDARAAGDLGTPGSVGVQYRSSVSDAGTSGVAEAPPLPADRSALVEAMLAALARVRRSELERGVSLVGPHRDELLLTLGPMPARGYASQGESWSLALSLRLAAYDLLRAEGDEPVLLLDDVFAELDDRRRTRLAELVAPAEQVLVTAAVADDVPRELRGARFDVLAGVVRPADTSEEGRGTA